MPFINLMKSTTVLRETMPVTSLETIEQICRKLPHTSTNV